MFNSNASSAAGGANYIEDVFSTWLYTGNGSTQTITNEIDLAGKGGLVWIKKRSAVDNHLLADTARGASNILQTDLTDAQFNGGSAFIPSFLSTGFTTGTYPSANTDKYASWTFREQPKFFDVVTYTGNGTSGRTIAHNLGSTPGFMIVKVTSTADQWCIYHRSQGATKYGLFNTDAFSTYSGTWNNTEPTSTVFTVGNDAFVNASGQTYVAYLFAHNAGGFGLTGTDNVISCGSFTTDGSGNATVNLGYEPQWLMIKKTDAAGNWIIVDTMRGFSAPPNTTSEYLYPNNSDAAGSLGFNLNATSTGFYESGGLGLAVPCIYIAIRRGPMKVPTTGTSVFQPATRTGTGTTATVTSTISPIDMLFSTNTDRVASSVNSFWDRLRGGGVYLNSNSTNAEASSTSVSGFDVQNGVRMQGALITNGNSYPYLNYNFRRAPGFFDEVCYTGNGSTQNQSHNLAAVPELMIVKARSIANRDWAVYFGNNVKAMSLNSSARDRSFAGWNDTTPTSSVFSIGADSDVNSSGATYVNYLFASAPGVSKVGSYTGTGTTLQVNCGFTAGSRFVLIKRTDSTGDWYVWDSARGIVAGNDPYLLLNSTAAEVTSTDYVDTYSAGFELTSTAPAALNASGGTYIFLAIA